MSETSDLQPPTLLRIFLVENHPDTLLYLRMYLESFGHTVGSARTVKEAADALVLAEYDVIISDIGLPDGNGWELLPRVQARLRRPLFAVAMSGFGSNADYERSRLAGYRHHLLKPFRPDELDGMLREAALELAVIPQRAAVVDGRTDLEPAADRSAPRLSAKISAAPAGA